MSEIIAIVATLISLGSFAVSYKAYVTSSRFASAGSEPEVMSLINNARIRISDISLKMQDILKGRLQNALNADEKRQLQGMESIYLEAVETLLNSYELACGLYRDRKLDRERFKRQYSDEIRKLFEGTQAYKDRLLPLTSHYTEMQNVYKEWFK